MSHTGVSASPRVAVLIIAWNRVDELVTCLESFACVDYPTYEVVVIDNGSEDATVPTVRERFPSVTLIANDKNLGYVGGSNQGFRYALEHDSDYVFVLNQDTKMTPSVLRELVSVMQSDQMIAAAGAKNLLLANSSALGSPLQSIADQLAAGQQSLSCQNKAPAEAGQRRRQCSTPIWTASAC